MAAATRAGPAYALPQRAVRACVRERARTGGGNSRPALLPSAGLLLFQACMAPERLLGQRIPRRPSRPSDQETERGKWSVPARKSYLSGVAWH